MVSYCISRAAQAAKRYRQMKDERDKLQEECSLLRKQKDHFMDKCNRLHSEKLGESLNILYSSVQSSSLGVLASEG